MNELLKNNLLIDFYGALLTEKQRDMYKLRYEEDMSLSEIAEMYNITRQGASETIKSAQRTLEDFEMKLGMVNQNYLLEQLVRYIDELDFKENEKKYINHIKREIEKIRR